METKRRRNPNSISLTIAAPLFFIVIASTSRQALAVTDPTDVLALQDLYGALTSPLQLKGWRLDGGDPCDESWTGVACSGSSVIHIKLQEMNLTGFLGGLLHNLHNVKYFDVSSNSIMGKIPYGLPPNATHINLASNNLTESIPHGLQSLEFLHHLNLSHNSLSGPIGNVFGGLHHLKEMDLSYNNFSGDLPSSFETLTNLTRLFLQNNQFTGSVVYLANLPLVDLNIQTNDFSGVIPSHFQMIPNLWMDGNKFYVDANYPLWKSPLDGIPIGQNFTGPPTSESSAIENYPSINETSVQKKKKLSPGVITGIVGAVALVATCAAIFIAIWAKQSCIFRDPANKDSCLPEREFSADTFTVRAPAVLGLRNIPPVSHLKPDKFSRRQSFHKYKAPTCAKLYTVAELQLATKSFSEENRLGEGSLGSLYKAEFPDGSILAVRIINTVQLSFHEEEQFLDVVWTISRLRHPNIATLLGYCVGHEQHVLVYEYIRNLSLDDALHNHFYKPLSWMTRLRIALGVAQGLDYLHSTFTPSVVHGNIKAANILLDEELVPHLCDSGLAMLRPLMSNSVKLKASEIAIDNAGYIAPDHGEPGNDNTKSDIYAFGVLLLELLTGMRPFDSSRPQGKQSLAKWASTRLHDSEYLLQMVDPSIKRTLPSKALSQFADVISLCIQSERLFRPPMSEILEALTSLIQKFTTATTWTLEGVEVGPTERSFNSTYTRFMGSPTVSFLSY